MAEPQRRAALEGLEVALTGRLLSMSRAEAKEAVDRAGGRLVARPRRSTALLVVGQSGPPLQQDGRLTASLRRAKALQEQGAPLAVIAEEELLVRLGLHERQADLRRLYTAEQLARILDVPARIVRGWVRLALLQPARAVGRLQWFDFGQVAAARALVQLAERGVSPARVAASLAALSHWLGDGRPTLSQLQALQQGGLFVRLPDGRLAEPSGQLRLGFEAAADAREAPSAAPLPLAAAPAGAPQLDGQPDDPAAWFDLAVRAEMLGELETARRAYLRALEVGGPDAEVLFNLGNVLYGLGERDDAARRFSAATALEPDYVEAWNNLGAVLADLRRLDEAARAYRRALALQPDYADAHYNLAEVLAETGDVLGARRHRERYLRLDPHSDWAARVRARLDELDADEGSGPRED